MRKMAKGCLRERERVSVFHRINTTRVYPLLYLFNVLSFTHQWYHAPTPPPLSLAFSPLPLSFSLSPQPTTTAPIILFSLQLTISLSLSLFFLFLSHILSLFLLALSSPTPFLSSSLTPFCALLLCQPSGSGRRLAILPRNEREQNEKRREPWEDKLR